MPNVLNFLKPKPTETVTTDESGVRLVNWPQWLYLYLILLFLPCLFSPLVFSVLFIILLLEKRMQWFGLLSVYLSNSTTDKPNVTLLTNWKTWKCMWNVKHFYRSCVLACTFSCHITHQSEKAPERHFQILPLSPLHLFVAFFSWKCHMFCILFGLISP